jgi:uncharacterized membrane protein YfcA
VDAVDAALVAGATFAAGGINAVAGGGSLVSFPALYATGIGALSANVTNTLAIWPGYASSAASLRANLRETERHARPFVIASAVGAAAGSALLLAVDPGVFRSVVPYLVLLSAVLLAVPASSVQRLRLASEGRPVRVPAYAGIVGAAAYGAYFGGGLGVVLLAVLSAFLATDLHSVNAMKAVLQLVVNTVALVAFVAFAPVAWQFVAVGAPASFAGGFVGARLSMLVPHAALRRVVVGFSFAVGVVLLVRSYT